MYIYNFMHQELKLFRDNTNLWSKYSFWKSTDYFSSLHAQVLPNIINASSFINSWFLSISKSVYRAIHRYLLLAFEEKRE